MASDVVSVRVCVGVRGSRGVGGGFVGLKFNDTRHPAPSPDDYWVRLLRTKEVRGRGGWDKYWWGGRLSSLTPETPGRRTPPPRPCPVLTNGFLLERGPSHLTSLRWSRSHDSELDRGVIGLRGPLRLPYVVSLSSWGREGSHRSTFSSKDGPLGTQGRVLNVRTRKGQRSFRSWWGPRRVTGKPGGPVLPLPVVRNGSWERDRGYRRGGGVASERMDPSGVATGPLGRGSASRLP